MPFVFERFDGHDGQSFEFPTAEKAIDYALADWNHLVAKEQKAHLDRHNGGMFCITEIDENGDWIRDVWDITDYLAEQGVE